MSDTFASTTLQNVIPSYLYQEYQDDDNLQALVASYNELSQEIIDFFNEINLPIYTSDIINGALLDWVAQGLYGITRPILSLGSIQIRGPFNTYTLDSIPFNGRKVINNNSFYRVSDDLFRRVITWNFYKGDGQIFSIRWLKRRIYRFLFGTNGTDVSVAATYLISVYFSASHEVQIVIFRGPLYSFILNQAINQGDLLTPFQYSFTVTNNSGAGFAPPDLFIIDQNNLA